METCQYKLKQKDGYVTKLYYYKSMSRPLATLLLFHGMAEHHNRYENFAESMNHKGFDVYMYDHRGHGTDKPKNELGFFSDEDGAKRVLCDALKTVTFAKAKDSTGNFFLMGHSMGSLILRNILQYRDDISGAIICGTTWPGRSALFAGTCLSSLIVKTKGTKHRSPILDRLLFGGRQYSIYSKKTNNDWLTRDEAAVEAYQKDPYCGFICTASFYRDLMMLAELAGTPKRMLHTRKDLPVFILSGDCDPVGGNGKEVQKLNRFYTSSGYQDITFKLYRNCRHELLNEHNKTEIINDISSWLNNRIPLS